MDVEAQGIGFAIPIDAVKVAIESWQKNGFILRPLLGVQYLILSPSRAAELGLAPIHSGALIVQPSDRSPAVFSGSPAERAGLVIGDVIVEADGKLITTDNTLEDVLLRKNVGDMLLLKVWREKSFFEATVELTNVVTPE
ncbi:MAG: trypsin-like protein serine protease [uncultured bacterium]|nr:MAG: trypsin-like protein serine protease [uncultured bacterium]